MKDKYTWSKGFHTVWVVAKGILPTIYTYFDGDTVIRGIKSAPKEASSVTKQFMCEDPLAFIGLAAVSIFCLLMTLFILTAGPEISKSRMNRCQSMLVDNGYVVTKEIK